MYPPLGILAYSTVYRWFGATFAVTNALTDLLSTLTILVTWRLALRLLDERLALAIAVVFTCLGATNGGTFALFSLMLYTPAILLGAIGLGLAIISALDLARDDSKFAPKGLLVLGVTIRVAEQARARRRRVRYRPPFSHSASYRFRERSKRFARWAVGVSDSGSRCDRSRCCRVYPPRPERSGADNLLAGVSGYGIPAHVCPLWPTGLGLLGAIAALGLSVAFIAALTLFYIRPWRRISARTMDVRRLRVGRSIVVGIPSAVCAR